MGQGGSAGRADDLKEAGGDARNLWVWILTGFGPAGLPSPPGGTMKELLR